MLLQRDLGPLGLFDNLDLIKTNNERAKQQRQDRSDNDKPFSII
jgi:hypothetical protein